jgi:hypothetical protein
MKEPGAMMFQGRIVCYDCSGDWVHAIELGSSEPLPMTPELNRAIHEDLARGRRKAAELGAVTAAEPPAAPGPVRQLAAG